MIVEDLITELYKYSSNANVEVMGYEFDSSDIEESDGTLFIEIDHYCDS